MPQGEGFKVFHWGTWRNVSTLQQISETKIECRERPPFDCINWLFERTGAPGSYVSNIWNIYNTDKLWNTFINNLFLAIGINRYIIKT